MGEYTNDSVEILDANELSENIHAFVGKNFPVTWKLTPDRKQVKKMIYGETWKEGSTTPEKETFIEVDESLKKEIVGYKGLYTDCSLTEEDKTKIEQWISVNLPSLTKK